MSRCYNNIKCKIVLLSSFLSYILSVIRLKLFIKAILSLFLVVAVAIVPKGLYNTLNTDKITDEMYKRREKYFYGVINVWQIDSFEGGKGSRTAFLQKISKRFEKKNNGVYINVETITLEKAKNLIESGQKKPDIVSYGSGFQLNGDCFTELSLENKPTLINKAISEKAVPWSMGGYFMIGDSDKTKWGSDGYVKSTKKGQTIIYSVGVPERQGHNALNSVFIDTTHENAIFSGTSQEIFDAYNFSYKVNRMIGTQRDLYRLQAQEKNERARKGDVVFLGCTDLFQYVSVLKCENKKKLDTMNKYVSFLIEKEQQDKLGSIGMFPVIMEAQPEYDNSFVKNAWQDIQKNGIREIL